LNNSIPLIIREACVETIREALTAETSGADQLEWCRNLEEDGLTPDYNTTVELLSKVTIPVKVMIRCRPGNFMYSREEIQEMKHKCRIFSALPGVKGIVFGALRSDYTLDIGAISELIACCHGKPMTIHKAIDSCCDILQEVAKLNEIPGVQFILSSGGAKTAWEGREKLVEMKNLYKGQIIAAGKINKQNLATLHAFTSLCYYHGRQITV
jgi:copper homeostasis protein